MKYILSLSFLLCSLGIIAQTPTELKSGLPEVEGWTISDNVEVFTEANLWNRINGSAPLFLENNFREMTALEYTRGDDYITIQAYRHASPEDAFGMYTSERSPDMNFYTIGAEGQGDDTNIYFVAGNMYVKIWANAADNIGTTIKTIAEKFAANIAPDAHYPAIIRAFPEDNKVQHSESYITSNYIGHEFLKSVYLANYVKDGKPYQLFVIDAGTADNAKDILTKYFTFTKQPLGFNEGELMINDRYNGEIPALWKGQYILGVFSESGDKIDGSQALLTNLYNSL